MHNTELWINKQRLDQSAIQTPPCAPLQPGQVRVQIERFAFTSNNVTYAAMGDAMAYWQFYPLPGAGEPPGAWGRIPVWGFGTVSESCCPEVPVGEHLYGYFPMSHSVVLTPGRISAAHWFDVAEHRAALPVVYNQYLRTAQDPFYRADTEDVQALLRPLFITSWLIDDFLADNDYFGAGADAQRRPVLLLSSASSKTAFGTAFQLRRRGGLEVVGLTSAANVGFCASLGCYDRVLRYDQLDQIATDAPAIYVDFAGNAAFRQQLHAHCQGLRYSCSIGGTHVQALGGAKGLEGPKPVLFFAPAQIKKRSAEWGAATLTERLVRDWSAFASTVTRPEAPWMTVQHHHGADAAQAAYRLVLQGRGDPRLGHILSL
ncbi:DUF2855 family protein [Curvibacter sp. APW13]|uniref:DUF2855 family protein n=1 Tax=Curvibacter sp. APW13 TaxID=3077236 RepID=UPI0028DECA9A|nr:DUF2855 family protein [Curvibacter sp. APW13]MDT8989992.1 DUF2855 family protein [Curvibacter sp. APW13]